MPQPNILEYLPAIFADVKEMIVHASAERPELEKLWNASDDAYNNQFLYSLTENGVERWEKIIGIVPLGTDTLEDRRFRIINRVNAQLPYTYRMMEAKLTQLCGKDGYVLSYTPETYTLKARVALTRKNQLSEVRQLLHEMAPINIIIDFDLQYRSHAMLSEYTHEFLANYTHTDLRENVF